MRQLTGALFFLLFVGVLFVRQGIDFYIDWLWFQEVGYGGVFTTTLAYKLGLGALGGLLLAGLVYLNLKIAAVPPPGYRFSAEDNVIELPPPELIDPLLRRMLLPGAFLIGLLAAPAVAANWQLLPMFLNPTSFAIADPVFGLDLSFFIFLLPALNAVYQWLIFALGLSLVASAAVYFLYRGLVYGPRGIFLSERARKHLLVLVGLILLTKAGGYLLEAYELLYSPRGAAFGAGYTDVNANLPALRALAVMSGAAAVLCFAQFYRTGYKLVLFGIGALVALHLVGLNVYPTLLQRFRVVPNEVDAEKPFLERTIRFTRQAYGLDKIESKDFPAEEGLSAEGIKRNDSTIKNIRLWEPRPLLASYSQLQEIRTYYKFVDLDHDRYEIDGSMRQVAISAREISHAHLQGQNWINDHLTFTHGYGVVVSPVNQVSAGGQPEFFIKDIPPQSTDTFKVTQPRIYFGELANQYILVKTKARELDYPAGDQNIYTTYDGRGGIPIDSFWRKLLFSAHFAALRITLSEDITNQSRILLHRKIQDRIRKIAPFITFDSDPFMVIAQGGRLFWMIDGYTTSRHYPYSAPAGRMGNYIRNSVKVIVDAYHGNVDFYLSDPTDPLVSSYAKIFPGLFKPLSTMPADLQKHIRYPVDLFTVQAHMYATFHVRDPQVFYNKEDLLSIPRKSTGGREQELDPYYTIMRLPGEQKEEFVLLLPFTPNKRDNMRAWLAARSDAPNYGRLIALNFPKAKLVYGPKQVDARIDQDTVISQQLSLWNQAGSQVVRGIPLAIPIDQSLLYVQPLYLAAEQGSLPELKRVIVAFGNQIAMEENLELALQKIFGGRPLSTTPLAPPTTAAVTGEKAAEVKNPAREALQHFQRAQELLRQGNWAGYGDELKKVEALLQQMQSTR
ncbi:MAG: UPF0182 family protein [Deltaproteobacteria bacterium]|nr:UPF0182 family protein [Deltaproteobacteria bacterium]